MTMLLKFLWCQFLQIPVNEVTDEFATKVVNELGTDITKFVAANKKRKNANGWQKSTHSDRGVPVWGIEKWKVKEAQIKEKARKITVVINKSDHDEEYGLAWKVETLADKEVKEKTKRDNSTAEILLNGEGKKKTQHARYRWRPYLAFEYGKDARTKTGTLLQQLSAHSIKLRQV